MKYNKKQRTILKTKFLGLTFIWQFSITSIEFDESTVLFKCYKLIDVIFYEYSNVNKSIVLFINDINCP